MLGLFRKLGTGEEQKSFAPEKKGKWGFAFFAVLSPGRTKRSWEVDIREGQLGN